MPIILEFHNGENDVDSYQYDNVYDMIVHQLNKLSDTDIYEIRDSILPNIIEQIEH